MKDKIFTAQIKEEIYCLLDNHGLFPVVQKGRCKETREKDDPQYTDQCSYCMD